MLEWNWQSVKPQGLDNLIGVLKMALFDNEQHELFFLAQLERFVDIQEAKLYCEHPQLAAEIMEQIQGAKEETEEKA